MSDYKKINGFYDKKHSRYGDSYRAVGWATKEEQNLRFNALIKNFDKEHLREESIVDFGCGLAHFLIWLQKRGMDENYLGVEIYEPFLKECKNKYSEYVFHSTNSFFHTRKKSGYIVANGVFTLPWGKNHEREVKQMIKRLYRKSKYGFSFTMLNSFYPRRNSMYCHFNPFEIGEYCYSFTNNLVIDSSYILEDFTITLLRK